MTSITSVLEESIRLHAKDFGLQKAHELACSAGIAVTGQGKVVRLTGNPFVVLLRLTRLFTLNGKLAALESCQPLLAEMEKLASQPEYSEIAQLSRPFGSSTGSPGMVQRQFESRVKS